eukprot:11754735-Karenia_brevis.AAC.1
MTVCDDDGQRLVDNNGQPLIPFDPKLEYDEGSACYLSAFAGSYRDVRDQERKGPKDRARSQAGRKIIWQRT